MRFCISLLTVVALAPAAHAADGVLTHPIRVDSREAFAESSAHATGEMRADGRYEFMPEEARAQARALLAKIDSELASASSSLAGDEREVNELFERNDGNRKICEMKSSTGSNLPAKICRKAADIERRKRAAAAEAGGGSSGGNRVP